jgi:hypothetical protein
MSVSSLPDPALETGELSLAGEWTTTALRLLLLARRECVDPTELLRLNYAIGACHEVIEPRATDIGPKP